jgi:hypothetical protein
MRTPSRSIAAAVAATLLIAACGSDSDANGAGADSTVTETESTVADTTPETTEAAVTEDTTPDTTEAATTETSEAPAQDIEADTAAAAAALITLAELPDGWTETPNEAGTEVADLLADCIGVDSLSAADARAASGIFANPDSNLTLTEIVGVNATEQDARFVLAGLTNPDVPTCLAAAYTELGAGALGAGAIADGETIGAATASRLAVGAAGDATQAIRVEVPVGDRVITVDHVVARSGRSIAALTFEGRAEATTVETIDAITGSAASRLPA